MLFEKIVVPYDKSQTAQRALLKAKQLAQLDAATKLQLIYVTSLPQSQLPVNYSADLYSTEPVSMSPEDFQAFRNLALDREAEEIKESIGDLLDDLENPFVITMIAGVSPADEIVTFAEENGCDLIVMGCRGLGALRGLLGSVSNGVLREASMPVLIVK